MHKSITFCKHCGTITASVYIDTEHQIKMWVCEKCGEDIRQED